MKIVNNKVVIEDNSYLVLYPKFSQTMFTDYMVFPESAFSRSELMRGYDDGGRPILLVYQ